MMPFSLESRKLFIGVVAFFIALTAFYATYRLTESPPTWYDEGIYIQVAQSFAEHAGQDMQFAPGIYKRIDFLTIGFPVITPVALSIKIFGSSLLAARLPMVLFILLFVAAAAFLVYRLFSRVEAIGALALLATFPLLYGNGKNVLGEIPGLLYATLALLLLNRLEKNNFAGAWNYVWLGLAVGLTAASKPIFLLLPAGIVICLLINIRSIPLRWREIIVGALSFAIPMLVWTYLQFGPDASASAILGYYANPYGVESVPTTVAENIVRFFKETTPLYAAALMSAWLLAIGLRMYRKEKISLAEQSAFTFSVLVMLAYLRTAGWYRYFFEAMTMALVFLAPSVRMVFSRLSSWKHAGTIIVTLLAAMQFYQLNFDSWVAEYYASMRSQSVSEYFSTYSKDRSIFIYNSPAAVIFLPTKNYYQSMQPTAAIRYGSDELELLKQGVPDDVLLSREAYESEPELFAKYAESGKAGAYLILSRK